MAMFSSPTLATGDHCAIFAKAGCFFARASRPFFRSDTWRDAAQSAMCRLVARRYPFDARRASEGSPISPQPSLAFFSSARGEGHRASDRFELESAMSRPFGVNPAA
jgi:hypothetical protein